jgi:ferric-dicitrate binding protein FerR (iron transport regulator)
MEERHKLMRMIRKGIYDADIDLLIDRLLTGDTDVPEMDETRAREILMDILAKEKDRVYIAPKQPFIKRQIYRIGVAAAGILIVVVAAWAVLMLKSPGDVRSLIAGNEETRPLEPGSFSGKQYIKLPDGSSVILNEESQLSFDNSFGQEVREVSLTGEGYFDIQHDTSRPFLVHIGDFTITVLGTAFNVRAYPADNEVQVAVTRGKVQVSRDDKSYGVLIPDEQLVINTVTDEFAQSKVNAETASSWKNNYLVIDNLTMEDAIRMIAGKYNVPIVISDKSLRRYRVTATFLNDESLEHVLMVVCEVIDARYFIDEQGNIQITGK